MDNSSPDTSFCGSRNTINLTTAEAASGWVFSSTDKIVNVVIIPLISFIGIFGNIAFLFSIFRIRSMQTILNVFTSNLAMADITYLVSVIYWALMDYNNSKVPNDAFRSWPECGIFAIIVHLSYFASLGFITLISIERYLAICSPMKHRTMKGRGRMYRLAFTVWFCSLLIAALYVPQFAYTEMCLVWPDIDEYKFLPIIFKACLPLNKFVAIYAMLIAIISFAVALVINSALYMKIIVTLSRRPSQSKDDVTRQQNTSDTIRHQVTRTLIINGIIFFICQMPYRVANVDNLLDNISPYDILSKKVYDTTHNIGISFFILNSCINPYLYVMSSRQYRSAMRNAFKTTFCRCLMNKEINDSLTADLSTPLPVKPVSVSVVAGGTEDVKRM